MSSFCGTVPAMTSSLSPNTPPTVWLLDVDHTIVGTDAGWHDGDLRTGTARFRGEDYTISWSAQLVDEVNRLHRTGHVQVVWCSTWCDDAHIRGLEKLLGLPVLDTAFATPPGEFVADLKVDAVRAVLASGRRLVWTDDSEVPCRGSLLHQELTATGRALLIAPSEHSCLRPKDILRIAAFVLDAVH